MAKHVLFTEEEPVDLRGLGEPKEVITEPTEEEIEKFFTFEPTKVDEVKREQELVEVTPLKDDNFCYAGVWYHLIKGRKQKVPDYVRDFLLLNKQNPRIKDIW